MPGNEVSSYVLVLLSEYRKPWMHRKRISERQRAIKQHRLRQTSVRCGKDHMIVYCISMSYLILCYVVTLYYNKIKLHYIAL